MDGARSGVSKRGVPAPMLYRPRDPVPRSLRWLLGVPAGVPPVAVVGTGGGSVGGAKFPSWVLKQAGEEQRPGVYGYTRDRGASTHRISGGSCRLAPSATARPSPSRSPRPLEWRRRPRAATGPPRGAATEIGTAIETCAASSAPMRGNSSRGSSRGSS